ncbi:M15 family metallopeptidase [Bacillus timonensis]|nr:M15 family metallopeptidase [Bacillus timonensis]
MNFVLKVIFISCLFLLGSCSNFQIPNVQDNEKTVEKQPIKKNEDNKNSDSKQPINNEQFLLEDEFFNQIEVRDGLAVILNPENILSLVNKEQSLPVMYEPTNLVIPNVRFSFGDQDIPKAYIREEAAVALEKMFESASNEGMILYAVSGYRSYERQLAIYNSQVKRVGVEKAEQVVAVPGHSEHQTGLAVDVTSKTANFNLDTTFGDTPEGIWVSENAYKFGFIVRYPKGKEQITGYQYEPWHLRFVGEKAAKVIYENQLTLEEYFKKVKKI